MLRRHKKRDALQGTLDLLVLKTLSRGPHHGYRIGADSQWDRLTKAVGKVLRFS
jgi:DNA-binding PadR family transcriptional regulator